MLTQIQYDDLISILTTITSAKTHFQIRSRPEVPGGREFEGDTVKTTTPPNGLAAIHVAEALVKTWWREGVLRCGQGPSGRLLGVAFSSRI